MNSNLNSMCLSTNTKKPKEEQEVREQGSEFSFLFFDFWSCVISWFFTSAIQMKNQKMNRRYIVVTPCRNEKKNLPNLIESMVAQTIKPALWVIVDDGSTDKTPEIIKKA